ncbi:MAG: LytTR family DNA-binding domain-containing protein [Verrucomicrobia bacterium]|nr:LytTR family DNA-binding domain-containing protein [Verrucomicrobiota bacterium]
MLRALLIDDEPSACDALRALLSDHPAITVAGEAGTLEEARALLDRADYDLVFLDIQLRGGTGFDLVPRVRVGARIIFVTAYDQHALRAFEINALDYLLKPVAPERLAASLARLAADPRPTAPSPPFPGPLTLDDRILVNLGPAGDRLIGLAEIRCITSCENYSEIHLLAGRRLLVRRTLKNWEDSLPPAHFARAHRHLIVNLHHVESLERATVSTFDLRLNGLPEPFRASYRYVADLRARLRPIVR